MAEKSFSFRLTASGFDSWVSQLKEATGGGERFDAVLQTLIRTSPQLASAADTAADRLNKMAEALKSVPEHGASASEALSKMGEVLASNTGLIGQFGAALATGGGIGLGIAIFERLAEAAKEIAVAIPEAGDQFTLISAQLNAVTGNAELGAQAYELLSEAAAKTGISVQASLAPFSRLVTTTRELGATTRDVADLVRNIQEIGVISGATAGQVDAVMTALSRSLATGNLDSRALRTILGDMPMLARNIADALGVSLVQLKEMTKAGELTGDALLNAVVVGGEKANEQFDKIPLTAARAKEILDHSWDEFLIGMNKATGWSGWIARQTKEISDFIDDSRKLLAPSAQETIDDKIASDLKRLSATQGGQDQSSWGSGPAANMARSVSSAAQTQAYQQLNEHLEQKRQLIQTSQLAEATGDLEAQHAGFESLSSSLNDQVGLIRAHWDKRIKLEADYEKDIAAIRKNYDVGNVDGKTRDADIAGRTKELKDALAALNKQPDSFSFADVERQIDGWRDKAKEAAQSTIDSLDPAAAAAHKYTKELEDLAKAQTDIGFSADRMGTLTDAAGKRFADTLDHIGKKGDSTAASYDRFFAKTVSGFEDAISKGESFSKIMQSLETDVAKLLTREFVTGPLLASLDKAGGASGLFGSLYNNTIGKALGTADTFGNAFTSTSADVATKAVLSSFKFAGGGIMSSAGPVPVRNYAGGGIANSPQWAQFGEGSSPEAYVPLPDGNSIPVRMQGGSGGSFRGGDIHIHMQGSSTGPQQLAQVVRYAVDQSHAELLAGVRRGGRLAQEFGRKR